MERLRNEKGFSRVEVICIIGISLMVLFVVIKGFRWHSANMAQAEDDMLTSTAQHMAEVNSTGTGCPIDDCMGGTSCTHLTEEGYVGYFDHPNNKIVADPVSGYNVYKTMTIDGVTYKGKPGTMVIKVVVKDDEITLSWVEGKK